QYKCPRCSLRTCSLACAKKHKVDAGCTGIRDKTAFVPKEQYGMSNLMSDYCFLEDAYRIADNAARDNSDEPASAAASVSAGVGSRVRLSVKQSLLQRECRHRRINLRFMPAGMKRHESNQSIYSKADRRIYWTVEWIFAMPPSPRSDLGVPVVDESTTVVDALRTLLKDRPGNSALRHQLSAFCAVDPSELSVRLRLEGQSQHPPQQQDLLGAVDTAQPLRDVLRDATVFEFPRLVVSLPCSDPLAAETPLSGVPLPSVALPTTSVET
ncbi:hypothetical protein BC831DRAFT_400035, partial [Entophlyctis helioformis]